MRTAQEMPGRTNWVKAPTIIASANACAINGISRFTYAGAAIVFRSRDRARAFLRRFLFTSFGLFSASKVEYPA
jgi:hypothetical protein